MTGYFSVPYTPLDVSFDVALLQGSNLDSLYGSIFIGGAEKLNDLTLKSIGPNTLLNSAYTDSGIRLLSVLLVPESC
jgi:hypothetical protein